MKSSKRISPDAVMTYRTYHYFATSVILKKGADIDKGVCIVRTWKRDEVG